MYRPWVAEDITQMVAEIREPKRCGDAKTSCIQHTTALACINSNANTHTNSLGYVVSCERCVSLEGRENRPVEYVELQLPNLAPSSLCLAGV